MAEVGFELRASHRTPLTTPPCWLLGRGQELSGRTYALNAEASSFLCLVSPSQKAQEAGDGGQRAPQMLERGTEEASIDCTRLFAHLRGIVCTNRQQLSRISVGESLAALPGDTRIDSGTLLCSPPPAAAASLSRQHWPRWANNQSRHKAAPGEVWKHGTPREAHQRCLSEQHRREAGAHQKPHF